MLIYKTGQIGNKEQVTLNALLDEIADDYKDFFITRDNLRLFLKDNKELLFENIKKGDKLVYGEEGILIVDGFSDKANRHYIKILSENNQNTNKLIARLLWDLKNIELYAKIKLINPIRQILESNGFIFKGSRGKEILLVKPIK
ncbi:hypothetical protein LCGC14_0910200 [marine sediment metagenome]|uniref:Uncharacterized protein n=1 Tax=marine sediment metagenome TaxID=412755 RepID=A0A0F9NTW4_9ZZZZ